MSVADAYDTNDALGLAALVRAGELSAAELLDEALARTEDRNPRLGAVVAVFAERARHQIAAGLGGGPLAGVPFLLKDLNTDLAGEPTTNGSRLFAGQRAATTSYLVQRHLAAGLVVFGKTNTPEMGLNVSTEPVLFGPTRNPWDPARSAGGSSGGAGAAVAGGIVPAAHATDGGGSIRIPASCNGLVGLKPTRARTPMGPPEAEVWNGLSHAHAVTRSVRDSAALLDATTGPTPGEPYSAPPGPPGGFLAALGRPPGQLRVGLATTARPGIEVHPECRRAAVRAGELIATLGHQVSEVELPVPWERFQPAFGIVTGTHVATAIWRRAAEVGRTPTADDLEAVTRAQLATASGRSAGDYVEAVRVLQHVGRAMGRWFAEEVDVVVTPTLGTLPPPLGELFADTDDVAGWGARAGRVACFLGVANATGQPAVSLPLHWSPEGLPVGVQLIGRFGDDATLLAMAVQLEEAAPWARRRPPVSASPPPPRG